MSQPEDGAETAPELSRAEESSAAEFALFGAEMLTFTVGGGVFGLPVERVTEVVDAPPITRLPFPRREIRGIASLRGEIIAILDLGVRLLNEPARGGGRLIVVQDHASHSAVGLLVDEVLGLRPLPEESEDVPAEVDASLPAGWVTAVVSPSDDELVTLLDLGPVLDLRSDKEETR